MAWRTKVVLQHVLQHQDGLEDKSCPPTLKFIEDIQNAALYLLTNYIEDCPGKRELLLKNLDF